PRRADHVKARELGAAARIEGAGRQPAGARAEAGGPDDAPDSVTNEIERRRPGVAVQVRCGLVVRVELGTRAAQPRTLVPRRPKEVRDVVREVHALAQVARELQPARVTAPP